MTRESPARIARKVLARVALDIGAPPLPIRFRACDLSDYFGSCRKVGETLVIELDRGLCGETLDDTIIHELAHAYAFRGGHEDYCDDHDATWGVAYARVFCAFWGCH